MRKEVAFLDPKVSGGERVAERTNAVSCACFRKKQNQKKERKKKHLMIRLAEFINPTLK